ncbi:MAG: mandelate racemase, partial [Mesorhizobium sp.]
VHLAATVEPRRMEGAWIAQEYIDGHFDRKNPVVIEKGFIAVPQRPGLGVKPEPGTFGKPLATYGA